MNIKLQRHFARKDFLSWLARAPLLCTFKFLLKTSNQSVDIARSPHLPEEGCSLSPASALSVPPHRPFPHTALSITLARPQMPEGPARRARAAMSGPGSLRKHQRNSRLPALQPGPRRLARWHCRQPGSAARRQPCPRRPKEPARPGPARRSGV